MKHEENHNTNHRALGEWLKHMRIVICVKHFDIDLHS